MVKTLWRALSILLFGFLVGVPVLKVEPVKASLNANIPASIPGQPIVYLAGHGTESFRVAAPAQDSALLLRTSAAISVNYLAAGATDGSDTCYAWPAGSQAAFSYAASIWATLITSPVPIQIAACWAHLATGILGHSRTDNFYRGFTGAPQANTWYPAALANSLAGYDLSGTDSTPEIHIAYSDNGINWYFGTNGTTPMGSYDFVSVVLHEITHGLGFAGSMNYGTGCGGANLGCWGWGSSYPAAYDRFTQNGSGQALLTAFSNPSLALGSALTSNNVWFAGANAMAANGGSPVKLYAPSSWVGGSSYSHLDESFNGTANALMTYSLNDGESVHDPGPITLGLL